MVALPAATSSERSDGGGGGVRPCAAGASMLILGHPYSHSGRSPVTGQEERATVVTRGLSDGHVLYALCIVPGSGYDGVARTFAHMLRTLNVNDDAAHRGTRTSSMSNSWR